MKLEEIKVIRRVIKTLEYEKKQADELSSWSGVFNLPIISTMQNDVAMALGRASGKLSKLLRSTER